MAEQETEDGNSEEIWQRPPAEGRSGRRSMKIVIAVMAVVVAAALVVLSYNIFLVSHFEISNPEWTIDTLGNADFTVIVKNVGYRTGTTSLICEIEMEDGTLFSNSTEITLSPREERLCEVIVEIPSSRITDLVNATGRCRLD